VTGPSAEFHTLEAALGGRYVLERELGRGGMGIVFLAREIALDRRVAIKLLPPSLAHSPDLVRRFLQEARTAARLAHPQVGDTVFFVMGYVPGDTLAERIRSRGPLAPAAVMRIVQEVAWALAHAHQHGVVHGDIKPENILLERGSGRALVADFGIARVEGATPPRPTDRVLGTARYIAPEQAAGDAGDGRSDLYSLGVTAFYALTGRYPFEATEPHSILVQHLTLPAPPLASVRPDVPPALAAAVDRCLAKAAADRFATAADLAEAVSAMREGSGIPETLRRISREISTFGVDLTGYATLAAVAIATQLARVGDFLGMGYMYTLAISLVLLSLTALRGMSVWRLVRDAVGEGWTASDLEAAIAQHARTTAATEAPLRPGRTASVVIFLAGLIGLVAFWIGPKELVQGSFEGPLAWVIELVSLIAPVAWGRWLGARLETPREGRPGLFSRLVTRFKAGFLFRIARLGRTRAARGTPIAPDAPTEALLAGAARDVLRALPDPDRHRFGADVEQLLSRLERDAAAQRRRLAELDRVAAQLGRADHARGDALARDLADARRTVTARLETTVHGMESLRLELLRHLARLAPTDGLTDDLQALRNIAARADAEAELDAPPSNP
jgi:hypothetical protein